MACGPARASLLDAQAHPELLGLPAGHESVVIRPDRYVFAAGPLRDMTAHGVALLDPTGARG
jgi:hypothetical protein